MFKYDQISITSYTFIKNQLNVTDMDDILEHTHTYAIHDKLRIIIEHC